MRTAYCRFVSLVGIGTCLLIAGCTTAFDLRGPDVKVADAWHARLPHGGHTSDLVSWWSSFDDPSLTNLITVAQASSPDLESATAEIDRARATLASSRAVLFPGIGSSALVARSGTGGDNGNVVAASTTASSSIDATWEIDLFGKARRRTESAQLRVDERVSDWHAARVSLAAEVADLYVQYRACQQLMQTYAEESASQRETVQATEAATSSGFMSNADLALAKANAASAATTLIAQRTECEVLVKSLTQVAGGDELRVREMLKTGKPGIPAPKALKIVSVPADAIRQRPDINALEVEVAASLAEVGAARADLYPSFSLGGSVTISSSSLTGAALPWSFGPVLSIPIFDGGSRRAAVNNAVATYDVAIAAYKSSVLTAVAEVETALVRIDSGRRQISNTAVAASNYRTYFDTVDKNWKFGGASLLDREEARRSAQSAKVLLIELRRDSVRNWIALYRALGGGWSENVPPSPPTQEKSKGTLL